MGRTRWILVLMLCCAVALPVVGCENLGGTTTTVTAGTTTTVAPDATTTTAGDSSSAAVGSTTTTAAQAAKSAAKPGAASTTTTSPFMGALLEPAPKDKLLKGTWTWDVDGDVDGAGGTADLKYAIVSDTERYLQPLNGALIGIITGKSFEATARSDVMAVATSLNMFSTSDANPEIAVGSIIALRTNADQYAKLQVTALEAVPSAIGTVQNMRLRYVLYPR